MNFRDRHACCLPVVREVLDQLKLIVGRTVEGGSDQRYFRAVVSPAGVGPKKHYFLKVAFTPLTVALLQREIQVVLALRGFGLPVPQVVAHNADRDGAACRFGLYEFVHSRSRAKQAQSRIRFANCSRSMRPGWQSLSHCCKRFP
jgi:hypothetical protein